MTIRLQVALIASAMINAAILVFWLFNFYPHFSIQSYFDNKKSSVAVRSTISPSYQGAIDLYRFENALFELGMGTNKLKLENNGVHHFNVISVEQARLTQSKEQGRAVYIAQRLMGNLYPQFENIRAKVDKYQPLYDSIVESKGFEFNLSDIDKIKALQNSIFSTNEVAALFGDINQKLEGYSKTNVQMFNVEQRSQHINDEPGNVIPSVNNKSPKVLTDNQTH